MLTGLNGNGVVVLADWASKDVPYQCPDCTEPLVLKQGQLVAAHFAHQANSLCAMSVGESARHMEMKRQIGKIFADPPFGLTVEYEVRFGLLRRADVVVPGGVVVECQASPISVEEVVARTQFYNAAGQCVLWVFDEGRLPERYTDGWGGHRREQAVRVPAEMRLVHQLAYGFLYVLDSRGRLWSCHLDRASPRSNDWGTYTPKTLRWVSLHKTGNVVIAFTSSDNQLRLAKMGEGTWWKLGKRPTSAAERRAALVDSVVEKRTPL